MAYFWTFSLLEAPLCPISPINSITCFLISLDFGYISCFLLLYIHFSHYGLLVFLRHGLFLDIFTSWSSIMSNFTINSYLLSLTANYFGIYFSQLPCLYPITCPYLKMIWKNEMIQKWHPSAITPFIIILQTLCNNPFIVYSTKYSVTILS